MSGPKRKALAIGLVVLAAFIVAIVWKNKQLHEQRKYNSTEREIGAHNALGTIQKEINKPGGTGKTRRNGTNIVLAVVDTERADFTGPYGARHPTTPFLDELASQGITFKNVFSTAPWTPPAMFSLMTGLYPSEHGVRNGALLGMDEKSKVEGQEALPAEAVTMAELLKEAGYTTFGINTNHHMHPKYGFAQGFDRFIGDDFAFLPYPNLMVNALKDEIQGSNKYFLWLHYLDPHFPYRTVEPWFSKWNDSSYATYAHFSTDLTSKYFLKQQGLDLYTAIDPQHLDGIFKIAGKLEENPMVLAHGLDYLSVKLGDDFSHFLRASYASEIRNTDNAMREALETLGYDDQTLVIATADHGEELFDHGQIGHRQSLYQELLRIPLVIRLPKKLKAGTVIDTPVSIIDILPTLLELLGIPVPKDLTGVSLVPLIEGRELPPRPIFSEVNNHNGACSCIIEYPWKLIHQHDGKNTELYNLSSDPFEQHNLVTKDPKRAKKMLVRLLERNKKTKPRWKNAQIKSLSPHELQALRQMGYIQ